MAICPSGAIEVTGRMLEPKHIFKLNGGASLADYEQLNNLFQKRRSMRDFEDKEVDPEITTKILEAASAAPIGIPPSDVGVLVLQGRKANYDFVADFINLVEKQSWIFSKWMLKIMRLFIPKADYLMLKNFAGPVFKGITRKFREGKNSLNYDAPLSMYFYGSPHSDIADPVIAATMAMLAGESLGLGTCMIGLVHPMIQNGKPAADFRAKYGIKGKSKSGVMVIFGYSSIEYKKGIHRSFASVSYKM